MAAVRTKLPAEAPVEGFMMTPMIDVVFQLIIFFMLVTNFVQQDIENVILPLANRAEKFPLTDPEILYTNVIRDGTIKIGGKIVFSPKNEKDVEKLKKYFEGKRKKESILVIRADAYAQTRYVQLLMMASQSHGNVKEVRFCAVKDKT